MRTHRLLVLTLTCALASTGAAKDEISTRVRDVTSAAGLAAPPRICVSPDSRVLVALPVADGVDVAIASGPPSRARLDPRCRAPRDS